MERLNSFVDKIEKLPTLPVIAQEILKLNNDPLLSIDKLKSIIEKDPAISAKILSVANSALFGFLNRTTNLNDAIMRIGFNNVKSVAVGISLISFLEDSKKISEYTRIFNHSIAVGLTARYIAHFLKTGLVPCTLILQHQQFPFRTPMLGHTGRAWYFTLPTHFMTQASAPR